MLAVPKAALRALGLYRPARAIYRFAVDPRYRAGVRLQRQHPKNLFQPFPNTGADRYPAIFRFARETLGDGAALRLLSFGCSTGEEVFSLRRYFPRGFVKGIDINPRNIALCEQRRAASGDPNIVFAQGDSTADEPAATYDAIFCMAVLRHEFVAEEESCDPYLTFADFERTVGDFGRCLKPGGLLALRHCNFRFADAAVSAAFECVMRLPFDPPTPLFGRDNRRLRGVSYNEAMFRKR
jgi:SAM-dependent methyltransferase